MVDFEQKVLFNPDAPPDAVPDDVVRALEMSAEDLEHGRIVELDTDVFQKEATAKLEAHRRGKRG